LGEIIAAVRDLGRKGMETINPGREQFARRAGKREERGCEGKRERKSDYPVSVKSGERRQKQELLKIIGGYQYPVVHANEYPMTHSWNRRGDFNSHSGFSILV